MGEEIRVYEVVSRLRRNGILLEPGDSLSLTPAEAGIIPAGIIADTGKNFAETDDVPPRGASAATKGKTARGEVAGAGDAGAEG